MEQVGVVIVGAGPAGLTVANLLLRAGIDCVLLEEESRSFIEHRARAGHIEQWAVDALLEHGLAERLASAPRNGTFEIRFAGERHRFDYAALSGQSHVVYPQQDLVTDLLCDYLRRGGVVHFDVAELELHGVQPEAESAKVSFRTGTLRHDLACDFVAGCDGAHGITRHYLDPGSTTVASHDYGVNWLALLAAAPPSAGGVLFGVHPNGFAAHMVRTQDVTRFYLQCAPDETVADWPDERIWNELRTRLDVPGSTITEGPIIERQILDLHNYVTEPMSHGRLHLAGESAHVIAPIAAKGMNLALHDAFLLAAALRSHYAGDPAPLASYSDDCLPLIWHYQEFSAWLAQIFHDTARRNRQTFAARTAAARLRHLLGSPAAASAFAEVYTGKIATPHRDRGNPRAAAAPCS